MSAAADTRLHEYIIERSSNGEPFVSIGSVTASPNKAEYNFVDDAPANGRNSYRLKMVNGSGVTSYASIGTVTLANTVKISVNVFTTGSHLFHRWSSY